MSGGDYNPHSLDAAVSRIETKLDEALVAIKVHADKIQKLEGEQNITKLKMAGIAGGATVIAWVIEHIFITK